MFDMVLKYTSESSTPNSIKIKPVKSTCFWNSTFILTLGTQASEDL